MRIVIRRIVEPIVDTLEVVSIISEENLEEGVAVADLIKIDSIKTKAVTITKPSGVNFSSKQANANLVTLALLRTETKT
jgi:hypothetical protein